MRLFTVAFLTALVVPLAAFAQSIKQVEVTNDASNPVGVVGEVEVTNLPAANTPARFQLVGVRRQSLWDR